MKKIACVLAALSLGACASDATFAHRLTAEQITHMGATPVSVTDNNFGLTPTWPSSGSAGTAVGNQMTQGLTGLGAGLIVGGVIAMMEADVHRRAVQNADEIETIFTAETLNRAMEQTFRDLPGAPGGGTVTVSEVSRAQKVTHPDALNDTIEIVTIYQMSDYSNGLRITSAVTYRDPTGVQIYNNLFTYYSPELQAPELTQDVRASLVAAITRRASRATGSIPTSGTTPGVDYIRDIQDARDDFLTRAEKGVLVSEQWLQNDGALLRAEIANAHSLIARYALLDLNRAVDPTETPGVAVIETLPNGRIVERVQDGFMVGTYVFRPAGAPSRASFSPSIALSRNQTSRNYWLLESLKNQ
ncbi:MAG: hypothetical protein EON87_19125 [Brevundimonas sp.]|nr:MAG: hypothetical protein EON87_19125 [Brevundimonas sp.]